MELGHWIDAGGTVEVDLGHPMGENSSERRAKTQGRDGCNIAPFRKPLSPLAPSPLIFSLANIGLESSANIQLNWLGDSSDAG